jgi:hypothetical protein
MTLPKVEYTKSTHQVGAEEIPKQHESLLVNFNNT